ncbi:hypothetical protein [Mycobacterium sp. NPDC004974]
MIDQLVIGRSRHRASAPLLENRNDLPTTGRLAGELSVRDLPQLDMLPTRPELGRFLKELLFVFILWPLVTEPVENPRQNDHQEEQHRTNAEEKQPFAWRVRGVSQSILVTVNLQPMECGSVWQSHRSGDCSGRAYQWTGCWLVSNESIVTMFDASLQLLRLDARNGNDAVVSRIVAGKEGAAQAT